MPEHTIQTVEQLQALYGEPGIASTAKVTPGITPHYRTYIETSPFCMLATVGPEGVDCSPRGDMPGFVKIADERTLLMPDRRGNNRVDSLMNIVRDPRVALCFMIPGSINCLRVNGLAHISVDPALKASFAVDGHEPRSVIVIETREVYFQCGRALVRSKLWEGDAKVDPASLPTPGEILAQLSDGKAGGPAYDAEWPGRAAATLW